MPRGPRDRPRRRRGLRRLPRPRARGLKGVRPPRGERGRRLVRERRGEEGVVDADFPVARRPWRHAALPGVSKSSGARSPRPPPPAVPQPRDRRPWNSPGSGGWSRGRLTHERNGYALENASLPPISMMRPCAITTRSGSQESTLSGEALAAAFAKPKLYAKGRSGTLVGMVEARREAREPWALVVARLHEVGQDEGAARPVEKVRHRARYSWPSLLRFALPPFTPSSPYDRSAARPVAGGRSGR